MYSELPDRLWATTGYKIKDLNLYKKFGKIRNQIIHFSVPNDSTAELTIKYTFHVVEKAINEWWDTTILEYALDYDDTYCEYIFEILKDLKIPINYQLNKGGKLEKK